MEAEAAEGRLSDLERGMALCKPAAPICPRCGHRLLGVYITVPGGAIVQCQNPMLLEGSVRSCGQRAAIAPHVGGTVVVLALAPAEYSALNEGRTLKLMHAEVA